MTQTIKVMSSSMYGLILDDIKIRSLLFYNETAEILLFYNPTLTTIFSFTFHSVSPNITLQKLVNGTFIF
jgi:hypothetical protein